MQIRKFVSENIVYLSTAVLFPFLYIAHFRSVPGGAGKSYFAAALVTFVTVVLVVCLRKFFGRDGARLPRKRD
jgi:prepilin signal peptidase PulO-like enzyme (type II secretory pathway)